MQPVDPAHYEYWSELAVDAEGTLYASKVVYFVDTELVDYEEIDRFAPGGREEVLYTLDHGEDEYPFDTHLLTLQVHGDHLYFDVRGEESVGLWRVPLTGGEPAARARHRRTVGGRVQPRGLRRGGPLRGELQR